MAAVGCDVTAPIRELSGELRLADAAEADELHLRHAVVRGACPGGGRAADGHAAGVRSVGSGLGGAGAAAARRGQAPRAGVGQRRAAAELGGDLLENGAAPNEEGVAAGDPPDAPEAREIAARERSEGGGGGAQALRRLGAEGGRALRAGRRGAARGGARTGPQTPLGGGARLPGCAPGPRTGGGRSRRG